MYVTASFILVYIQSCKVLKIRHKAQPTVVATSFLFYVTTMCLILII